MKKDKPINKVAIQNNKFNKIMKILSGSTYGQAEKLLEDCKHGIRSAIVVGK